MVQSAAPIWGAGGSGNSLIWLVRMCGLFCRHVHTDSLSQAAHTRMPRSSISRQNIVLELVVTQPNMNQVILLCNKLVFKCLQTINLYSFLKKQQ